MDEVNSFVFLMFLAILLVGLAQRINVAYPIALVIGGSFFGFLPGIVPFKFNPHHLLTIVLPPILFYASYNISIKDFKLYFNDVFSVAVGLVIATTLLVAFLLKWIMPEVSWGLAFAFGALISPPDAVAATTTLKQFSLGTRLRTILEGESLVNDATALVIYRFAVIALLTGSFSYADAAFDAFYVVGAGLAIGLICGYILNKISSYLSPALSAVYSFIIPYLTYCLADSVEASGVIAVVACGLVGARMLMTHFAPLTRVLAWTSWDILIILLNCYIFILIGLEMRHVIEKMSVEEIFINAGYGLLFTLAIVLMRYIWIYTRRLLWHFKVRGDPKLLKKSKTYFLHAIVSGWAGMRGIVSLTAALALPVVLADGTPVVGRDTVLFLTFEIIFLTLVVPGLTLPWLIKWLKIKPVRTHDAMPEIRKQLSQIATEEIDRMHRDKEIEDHERDLLHNYFGSRHKIMEIVYVSEDHQVEQARHKVLHKQRDQLVTMWLSEEVNEEVMNDLISELDIEDAHLVRGQLNP